MYRIVIKGFEKLESFTELTNEFLRPDEYIITNDDSDIELLESDKLILVNESIDSDPNKAKRDLFEKLSSLMSGDRIKDIPKWGILTGVRPVKLARELSEKTGTESAKNRLMEEYLLDESKARELIDIYDYQLNSLGKAPNDSLAVYVGIPFCPTRCLYCSFASNQSKYSEIERYLDALIREIKEVGEMIPKGTTIESIYIGGGTPTTLNSRDLERLINAVQSHLKLDGLREFTVEAGRPDTIDEEKLLVLKNNGVGRISINPQSMKASTLELIGRSHSPEDIERAFDIANKIGFNSINCDLIAGLPEETLDDFKYSLDKVLLMGADNITVHSLAVKRASRLIEEDPDYHYKQGRITSEMIEYGNKYLKDKGFRAYYLYRQKHMAGAGENTGYSLPGKEGLYNVRIMDETQSILAFGAGGISKVYFPEENRLERVPNIVDYRLYIERLEEMIDRKRKDFFYVD